MKRLPIIVCVLLAVTLPFVWGADDRRNLGSGAPIASYAFTQQTWANGEGHAAKTASTIQVSMLIERIDILISDPTNTTTVDITITDDNGVEIVSLSTLTDDTKHYKSGLKSTADFTPVPVNNILTVSIDPSADSGTTSLTVDVIVYGP